MSIYYVDCSLCYPHPYQYELDRFQPAEHQLTAVEPTVSRFVVFRTGHVSWQYKKNYVNNI